MTFALLCALAQGTGAQNVNYIYYTLNGDGKTITKHDDGTAVNPKVLTSKLISGNDEDRLYDGWYVLNSSFSYGERIVIYGDVKLILADGCTLKAEQGIRINTDATLTIYAQSEEEGKMGKLVAIETHHDKAAIGGNKNWEAGRLIIHGGEIEAKCNSGSKYAAGIGGGYGDGSGMKEITIYGGKVTAEGAKYGAGIGGGKNNNHPGTINIYGGTVKASAGEKGAGIGGGENRNGWNTLVCGGNVTAQGGISGAGIGGGIKGNGGKLHFQGGTVNAIGGTDAAGIGGGNDADGGTITIDGGNITGSGKFRGSGIGGGAYGSAGTITINGGTVTAVAGSDETFRYNEADRHQTQEETAIYHIPSMMGNGADGEKKGTVTIGNGATVHLRTTNEFEDECAPGIGCANLTLGSNMKVRVTMVDDEPNDASTAQRVNTCRIASRELDIEPCTEHALEYTVTEQAHTASCLLCAYTSSEAHSIIAPSTKCEKCDYDTGSALCTLAFPQTSTAKVSGYATAGFQAVQGQTIVLLDCTKVPEGWKFVGWLKQSDVPASIEAADDETLLQPGEKYTVQGNEVFFARYRRVFTETWQWSIETSNVQATVTVNNGSDQQQISAKVTPEETVEATATTPGYTIYTATATYKPNNTTYTFTNERIVVNYITVELNETDNTGTLADNDGGIVTATLTGRTLFKDGRWNTLCLPFSVALEGSALEGATVKELTDASVKDGTLTLTFADATFIEAGRAYLIKWDSGSDLGPSDLVFTGVTLDKNLNDDEISLDDSGKATVTFLGTYEKLSIDADDKNILYVGSDNQLCYPKGGVSIEAQQAYFKLSGIEVGDQSQQVNTFVLDFGDTSTSLSLVEGRVEVPGEGAYYDLSGRKLAGKPSARGIYIYHGKKFVISF